MSTPTIPSVPPQPPAPPRQASLTASPAPQPSEGGGASRVVAIMTIALGCAIVLGAIGSATFSTVAAASVHTESQQIDVAGVTDLAVSVDAATLQIEFADVSEATLEVTSGGGAGAWTLERDGDELVVATPHRFGPWWFFGGEVRATLTLPQELEGTSLDASLDLSAGDLTVDGEFGDLGIDVGAGSLTVDGAARELSVELSAGGADIDLSDVREAEFSVSAGAVDARLNGSAPRLVSVDVSAGSLDLKLPNGRYDVRSDVSAGEFDNRLSTDADAENVVDVTVSAGTVTIVSAR